MSLPEAFSRKLFSEDQSAEYLGSDGFRASVALILCVESWSLMIIKRAKNEKDPWSGHYGFPGGMLEPGENSVEAVIRECQEEVGLQLTQDEHIGSLSPYRISYIRDSLIFPHVFACKNKPALLLDKTEVDQVYFWELGKLLDSSSLVRKDFQTQVGILNRPALVYEGHSFWGISLGILNALLVDWKGLEAPWGGEIRPFNLS